MNASPLMKRSFGIWLFAAMLSFGWLRPAQAHVGPPFPIITDQPLPGHIVTVWADPDIGESVFYVVLEPAASAAPLKVSEIDVWVEPVSHRLPKKVYKAVQETARGHLRFAAKPEFDAQEMWTVGVDIRATDGTAHAFTTQVEATPPGLGPWDLLINLFPFVLFGALWVIVFARKSRKKARAAHAHPASPKDQSNLHHHAKDQQP